MILASGDVFVYEVRSNKNLEQNTLTFLQAVLHQDNPTDLDPQ